MIGELTADWRLVDSSALCPAMGRIGIRDNALQIINSALICGVEHPYKVAQAAWQSSANKGFDMRKTAFFLLAAGSLLAAAQAQASTIVLTFEGVGNEASVDNFYNGGTDSAGHSGTNYGINFSPNSLGLIDSSAGGSGNTGNDPSGVTNLFFLSGGAATMNVAAGFTTGFSFFYAANKAGFVNVYDGLNGTGNLLASIQLSTTSNAYYNWVPIGVSFSGVAQSVDFGGVANYVTFDNITLGAAIPGGGGVPEPATWAMMIAGFGAVGGALRVRRRKVSFAAA